MPWSEKRLLQSLRRPESESLCDCAIAVNLVLENCINSCMNKHGAGRFIPLPNFHFLGEVLAHIWRTSVR